MLFKAFAESGNPTPENLDALTKGYGKIFNQPSGNDKNQFYGGNTADSTAAPTQLTPVKTSPSPARQTLISNAAPTANAEPSFWAKTKSALDPMNSTPANPFLNTASQVKQNRAALDAANIKATKDEEERKKRQAGNAARQSTWLR
jgi:hypothetical protein